MTHDDTFKGAEAREPRLPLGDTARHDADRGPSVRPVAPPEQSGDKDDEGGEDKDTGHQGGGLRNVWREHPLAVGICGVLLIAGIIAGILYYLHARHFENTDDAFIDGRPVLISPQVTGTIIAVPVTDNQVVKAGDLLARIDSRDYAASVAQAQAQIDQARASIGNYEAQVAAQQAQVDQASKQIVEAQAALSFARDENTRYQDLVAKGAGTAQRAQQAASDLQSKAAALAAAEAAKQAAEAQINAFQAQKRLAIAQVAQFEAQKASADANLSRTELRAPVDGRVAKLTGAVGALATSAQSLMVVVPLDIWVTANFKETQLADMKVGQPVDIRVDAFGRSFPGHVNSVQAGSGTAFSLLPAENATGNYVKVVQRVPVKITFDHPPDVELGPGMSVVPSVTVRP